MCPEGNEVCVCVCVCVVACFHAKRVRLVITPPSTAISGAPVCQCRENADSLDRAGKATTPGVCFRVAEWVCCKVGGSGLLSSCVPLVWGGQEIIREKERVIENYQYSSQSLEEGAATLV